MSNIDTCDLPPNTARSLSSALIMRLFILSCRPLRLMYAHSFLVTSVRGMEPLPITAASVELVLIGFMNAAFGLRPLFFAFLGLLFFAFAIDFSPVDCAETARVVGNDF